MNKEILRKNIEEAIMQPCLANPWNKADKSIKPNGLSEDGKTINVKTDTDDTSALFFIYYNGEKNDYVQDILDALPEKYRDHLVTIKHDDWISCSYIPVFDTDTQAIWDKAVSDYIKAKQKWCDKYGCD